MNNKKQLYQTPDIGMLLNVKLDICTTSIPTEANEQFTELEEFQW